MSNDEHTPPPNSSPRVRRSSFAGQTLADLFGSGRQSVSRPSQDGSSGSPPAGGQSGQMGPITAAASQAHQRRMSLNTLGISGSPGQTSPFGSFRGRRESFGSTNSGSIDESAIDDDGPPAKDPQPTTPGSPFARRMSFGAQALRDVRNSKSGSASTGGGGGGGGGNSNGRSPPTTIAEEDHTPAASSLQSKATAQRPGTISSRSDKGRDGFNWSENLRTRAERTSIAGPPPGGMPNFGMQNRSKSIANAEQPVKEMPKPPQKRPDHFQERILKGDFYMD